MPEARIGDNSSDKLSISATEADGTFSQEHLDSQSDFSPTGGSSSAQSVLSPGMAGARSSTESETYLRSHEDEVPALLWTNEQQSKLNLLAAKCQLPISYAANVLEQNN